MNMKNNNSWVAKNHFGQKLKSKIKLNTIQK